MLSGDQKTRSKFDCEFCKFLRFENWVLIKVQKNSNKGNSY